MGQDFPAVTSADAPGTAVTNLATRDATLRSSFSGASSPGSPVNGELWADTTDAADVVLNYYNGTAWTEVGSLLHDDLVLGSSAAPYTLLGRLENRNSHIAAAAGQIGRAYLFTTDNKARVVVSGSVREVVLSASSVDYYGHFIPIGACDLDGTNPPTATTVGTTPTVRGMLFDATNEKCSFGFVVPAGYSADADCKVRVWAYLSAGETNNDTIDAQLTLVSVKPNVEELPTGTSTTSTVSYSIGTGNTQYSLHKFDFVIDFDDATNPIEPGDFVEVEFNLTSVASVAGIIVRAFQPLFTVGTKITE